MSDVASLSLAQRSLAETDPEIAEAIRQEVRRQADGLELIASENFVSRAVLEAVGKSKPNTFKGGQFIKSVTISSSMSPSVKISSTEFSKY